MLKVTLEAFLNNKTIGATPADTRGFEFFSTTKLFFEQWFEFYALDFLMAHVLSESYNDPSFQPRKQSTVLLQKII